MTRLRRQIWGRLVDIRYRNKNSSLMQFIIVQVKGKSKLIKYLNAISANVMFLWIYVSSKVWSQIISPLQKTLIKTNILWQSKLKIYRTVTCLLYVRLIFYGCRKELKICSAHVRQVFAELIFVKLLFIFL